jgi:hypothetical protein
MMKYAILVFKNLTRSKRRTILTILAIAISLFIFAILVSLPTFASQVVADSASSVRIACRTKMGWDFPLPEAYGVKIKATPHVAAMTACVIYGGVYHDISDQFPSLAMDAETFDGLFPDWGITGAADFDGRERFGRNPHVGQPFELRDYGL